MANALVAYSPPLFFDPPLALPPLAGEGFAAVLPLPGTLERWAANFEIVFFGLALGWAAPLGAALAFGFAAGAGTVPAGAAPGRSPTCTSMCALRRWYR